MQPCLGCTPLLPIREAGSRLGVTRRHLARLLEEGTLLRVSRWLVVGCCVAEAATEDRALDHRLKLDVLLHRHPDAAATSESAATVLGLPLLTAPRSAVVTRSAGAWRSDDFGKVRIGRLPPEHVIVVDGIRCTAPARTFVDIARTGSLAAAVVVGDAVLRRRSCRRTELVAMVDECAGWLDVGKARRAVQLLDARSESPFESLSRIVFHERDVPSPELQAEVVGASGRRYRADFYWDHRHLIGEADGRAKYFGDESRSPEQVLLAEKDREDDLREAGYGFVRWRYGQILRTPEDVVARVMRKLR